MDFKKVVKNIKTNQDFMHYVMNYSSRGALCQTFVIEALRCYCEKITEKGEPKDDPTAFISPIAWYETGLEIQNLLKAKYESE